jgi:toxin ParE1/3/4
VKRVEFHSDAEADAAVAFQWYESRSLSAALGFYEELNQILEAIQANPGQFLSHILGTRKALLNRYPLSVIFREQSEVIQVIAVAHAKRRPGYWGSRL